MSRINIKAIAEQVNRNTQEYKYFWSYGILKETKEFWQDKNNYSLLSLDSQAICDSVLEQ